MVTLTDRAHARSETNKYVAGDKTEMVVKRRPTYKLGEPLLIILYSNVGTEVVARYLGSMTLSVLAQPSFKDEWTTHISYV